MSAQKSKTITIRDEFDTYVEVDLIVHRDDEFHVIIKTEWVVFFCQVGRPDLRNEIHRFDKEPSLSEIWSVFSSHH